MAKISIVEHFYSIQGEGPLSGVPSVFIRFGGCNLRCEGFKTEYSLNKIKKIGCDSYYAVDQGFSENWREINRVEDILEIIFSYPVGRFKDIVITGGEPLIYAENRIFLEMLSYLKKHNFRITIETNGTIYLKDRDEFKDIKYSIALKLSNSGEEFNKRFNIYSIHSIINKSKDCYFKFTLDNSAILKGTTFEVIKISKFFPDVPIYCMPVGATREEIDLNSQAVVKLCLNQGFIYSDRLQVRIWNGKKGY